MNGQDQGFELDVKGLEFIGRFGWLTVEALARLMYPNSQHQMVYARRLIRKWLNKKYVLKRQPSNQVDAYVLAENGIDFMWLDVGQSFKTGKNWGEYKNGIWMPPTTWRHDLLAHHILASQFERGSEVWSEYEIRQNYRKLKKIPDGLIKNEDGVFWLEVEYARKTGTKMTEMVNALNDVEIENAPSLFGQTPTIPAVGYLTNLRDDRGHKIDHRTRVMNALYAHSILDFNITIFSSELKRGRIEGVGVHQEPIRSGYVDKVVQDISWFNNQSKTAETWSGRFMNVVIKISSEDDLIYEWEIEEEDMGGTENFLQDAKRKSIMAYLSVKRFEQYYANKDDGDQEGNDDEVGYSFDGIL